LQINPEYGEVIQLQGDQRTHIRDFLKIVGIAREDQLKVKLNGHLFARTKFVYFYNNDHDHGEPSYN
jgi:hypothetical protein